MVLKIFKFFEKHASKFKLLLLLLHGSTVLEEPWPPHEVA
jgi:hypothetical protein